MEEMLSQLYGCRHPLRNPRHTLRRARGRCPDRPDKEPASRADHQEVKGVSQPLDLSELDDFQVIEERRKVMAALAFLTDKYRDLNEEMTRRKTLRWMTA